MGESFVPRWRRRRRVCCVWQLGWLLGGSESERAQAVLEAVAANMMDKFAGKSVKQALRCGAMPLLACTPPACPR